MHKNIINMVGMTLCKTRLNLSDEKLLQNDIAKAFDNMGISYKREVRIDDKCIIDFIIGRLGIEIKVKGGGSTMNIYRQIERYCVNEHIDALLLLTSKTMRLPETIANKAVYVISLGRTQL